MIPNPISLLIGQMRGTSHESQITWVGCLDKRTTHPVHKSPRGITGEGRTIHPVHSAPLGEGESPYGRLLLQEVPQAPQSSQSSQSSMHASFRTLIRGSLNNSKLFSESQKFELSSGLRQNVCDLHISPNAMEPSCSSMYHISDKVVPDVYMLEQS